MYDDRTCAEPHDPSAIHICIHTHTRIHVLMIPFSYVRVQIPMTLMSYITDEDELAQWRHEGLPADASSEHNAVMVARSKLWPLLIDPHRCECARMHGCSMSCTSTVCVCKLIPIGANVLECMAD